MRRVPVEQPVFWVLTVGIVLCVPLQLRDLAVQAVPVDVLGLSLLVVLAEAALFWVLAGLMQRRKRRPAALRLFAMGWGLSVVPVVASFANTQYFGTLNALGLRAFGASIAAPIDEDLLRFVGTLGVLALASRGLPSTRLTTRDGLVFGFLVGAGFEVAENLAFLLSSTDLDGTLQLALVRLGIGFGLHAFWTAISGAALAYACARKQAGLSARWPVAVLGLVAPMLLHALWDAPSLSIVPAAVFSVLGAVYLLTLVVFGAILVEKPALMLRRRSVVSEVTSKG